MLQVNVFEAKTNLSKLLMLVESRDQDYIVIARNGKPVARIVPIEDIPVSKRIGVAKGKFTVPDDLDVDNDEIAAMFEGAS